MSRVSRDDAILIRTFRVTREKLQCGLVEAEDRVQSVRRHRSQQPPPDLQRIFRQTAAHMSSCRWVAGGGSSRRQQTRISILSGAGSSSRTHRDSSLIKR